MVFFLFFPSIASIPFFRFRSFVHNLDSFGVLLFRSSLPFYFELLLCQISINEPRSTCRLTFCHFGCLSLSTFDCLHFLRNPFTAHYPSLPIGHPAQRETRVHGPSILILWVSQSVSHLCRAGRWVDGLCVFGGY